MTGPISFPTISGPQLAPARRSSIDGLAELLVGISQHRQQLAVQREGLELERQRTEASVAASGEQAKESAANRKQKQLEFEQKQQALEAADIAETEIGNMLQLGGVTPERMNEARAKILERAKGTKLPPYVLLGALDNAVQRNEETFGKIAQRTTAESVGKVQKGTEAAQIETAGLQRDNAKLERTMRELQVKGFDTQKLSAAQDFARASGLPWGAVSKQFGMPIVPGGLPASFVFPDASAKAAGAASAQMGAQLRLANDGINALGGKGLSPAAYAALSAGAWTTGIINTLSSREQQELGTAYAAFIAPIQAVAVKGAASDSDVQRMQRAYVTLESDAPSVKAQKSLIRTALAESWDANATADEMSAKFDAIIKEFKMSRTSPVVAPFLDMLAKVKKVELSDALLKKGEAVDSRAPGAHARTRPPDDPEVARLLPPSR